MVHPLVRLLFYLLLRFFTLAACAIIFIDMALAHPFGNAPKPLRTQQITPHTINHAENIEQLKQTIREVHLKRMQDKRVERQLEKQAKMEEEKREKHAKRKMHALEKKEIFNAKQSTLSFEERRALRKQIKEAKTHLYEKKAALQKNQEQE